MKSCFIDDLVDDLLIEILLRLPVKAAHRCKSVCKRWFSLISSPYFVHKYVLFFKSRSTIRLRYSLVFEYFTGCGVTEIACKGSSFRARKFYFDFPNTERELRLLGTHNDLVLCGTVSQGRNVYHVCNPFTRQLVSLPPPPEHGKHGSVRVGFFCDDILQGFSRLTHYKVVLIDDEKNFHSVGAMFEIKIFSSDIDTGGGDWSEVSAPCPPGLTGHYFRCTHVAFCNGILHWGGKDNIVTYDLYNKPDHCNLIGFPSDIRANNGIIGVRQGRIQLSSRYVMGEFPITLYVWELEDYNNCTWCLKHKFHLSHSDVGAKVPCNIPSYRSVSMTVSSMNEDYIALILFWGQSRHPLLFNMNSKTPEVILHEGELEEDRVYFCNCFPFFSPWWPTLIPEFETKAMQL